MAEIKRREKRKAKIERAVNRPVVDRDGLRRALDAKLTEWKRLLRSRPTHGQTVLRNLLDGPILVGVAEGDAVSCEAQPSPWGLLGGIGILSTKLASPTGRRETYEAGYGEAYELPLSGIVKKAA